MEILIHLGQALVYLLIVMVIMWLTHRMTSFNERNLAISLRQSGIFLGSALALFGVLHGSSNGFLIDIQNIVVYGVFSTVAILVSLIINNYLILPRMNNRDQLIGNNTAVGFAEFGTAVGTGLIMMGAMTGDGSMLSAIVFFLLGQMVLVGITYVYEYINPLDVIDSIKSNNDSSGIMLGGVQIAMGIMLSNAVKGDFVNWTTDITSFVISAISGIILIGILFNKYIDKIYLPKVKIYEEMQNGNGHRGIYNIVLAVIIKISLAILVSSVIL